ncbi:hypothetical protein F511_33020 [Dorcoceras hygrometricum]|uniref:Dystroglycan-like n=1 Tax=Dorcoceras hygrometricum TaxID=472368 RepID=A0A2Z7AD26_9LAMI|nr:hypothetical protein F511_33020 [Dorcoceras hygrometricum]
MKTALAKADSRLEQPKLRTAGYSKLNSAQHCPMLELYAGPHRELVALEIPVAGLVYLYRVRYGWNQYSQALFMVIVAQKYKNSPKLNDNRKAGIDFSKPENSKPIWLKNRLDKDKAKAGRKPFVPNQPWRSSTKLKSGGIALLTIFDFRQSSQSKSIEMASTFIANSYQVNFDSVLLISDHDGMLNMFKALEASGLRGFLGCESVVYEKELEQFFDTALVQDGDITGAVSGKFFSVSQARFAEIFELPTEGLVSFSDVPKHLVYKARSIFSQSGEQVSTHGKKRLMKYEYRLLNDILAKAITDMVDRTQKKSKGYAAQIGVLLKSIPAITMGEGVPFPISKILYIKTVNTYIAMNHTIDARGQSDEPGQDVVPLQIIEPTPAATVVKSPAPKRISRKRRLVLPTSSDDEIMDTQEPVKDTDEIAEKHTDEIDDIICQIIAETSKMGSDEKEQEEQRVDETDIGDDFDQWLEESFKDFVVNETGTIVEAESSKAPVVEKDMEKAVGSKHTEEEHMSIDDLLLQISDDMMLPSVTAAEITKIRLGESININEVHERDWYYASLPRLPRISTHDKGKEPLEENEPVRGNPAKETVELICGDVDFLVQLRDKVMTDVVDFFHSFSLNKLSEFDGLRDLKEKEKLMLSWAETEFLETDVKRRMYILAKYREMLLRKFLDSHRRYFAPGQPWKEMASHIIALLSVAHSKSLEDLLAQQKERGIITDRPSSSQLFKYLADNSGAVLAQFYSMAKSTCWVRPMIFVNGVWTPIQGNDFWRSSCRLSLFVNRRQVPESVVDTEFGPRGFFIEPVQYWGAAPSLIKTWGWARVCTEIVRYSMFGCLLPVRKDVCRDIVVYSLAVERILASFRRIFQQGVYTDSFVGYFSDSDVQSIPEFDSTSSDGSTVYRSPSPQVESFEEVESVEPIAHLALGPAISGVAQEEQSFFVESPESPPITFQRQDTSASSSDSPMHFNSDDIPLDDTAYVQPTFPAVNVDLSPLLDDLKISLSQRMDNAQSDILSRLHTIEIECSTRWSNQDDIQTLRFNAFKKVVLAQGVTAGADSVEVRKEIKALDAKINSLDGQVAAIRNEQLEFQTKIAADILSLSTQLGDLVDYIRGDNAKKGEGSSSRRPLPPPVNQGECSGNRTSGDTVRTTEIAQRDIDNAQRDILERLMAADRQMERERGSRSRSGSHKSRRY